MELQKVKIADLSPHPMNYNTHPEEQLVELEKSLESFSQFKNIVVCQNVILAGHGLVEAAKRKGIEELDAVVMDDLTEDQQKALLVADNATPYLSIPDPIVFKELLDSLPSLDIAGLTDEILSGIPHVDAVAHHPQQQHSPIPEQHTTTQDRAPQVFQPTVNPEFSRTVTDKTDIEKAQHKLETQFNRQPTQVEVMCPHCGEEFYINRRDI